MLPKDSDSSDEDSASFTTTNVLLGYASKETTDDTFSQLGGYPVSRKHPPRFVQWLKSDQILDMARRRKCPFGRIGKMQDM